MLKDVAIMLCIILKCVIVRRYVVVFVALQNYVFYGCEILNYNMSYRSNLYVSWHKIIRQIFWLPQRTHNFIVSNIGNCVIICLDCRLCKIIYNLWHNDNLVVKQITEYKMLSLRSTLANNYRYLCSKYKYSYNERYSKDVNTSILN